MLISVIICFTGQPSLVFPQLFFSLTAQLDHRRLIQESCSLPIIQLPFLFCNTKGLRTRCSGQRPRGEPSEACVSAPSSAPCPGECFTSSVLRYSFLLLRQQVKSAQSFAGQLWSLGASAVPETPFRGEPQKTPSEHRSTIAARERKQKKLLYYVHEGRHS